jgi:hypothetical protein
MDSPSRKRTAEQAGLPDYNSGGEKRMRLNEAGDALVPQTRRIIRAVRRLSPERTMSSPVSDPLQTTNIGRQPSQLSPLLQLPLQQPGQLGFSPPLTQQQKPLPSFDFSTFSLKDTGNQMGLWQMDATRQSSLKSQLPTFLGTTKPSDGDIRIKAVTGSNESWGVSADENVRTQFQRDNRKGMKTDEAEIAFNQRSHQGTLLWSTESPSLTQYGKEGDSSQPLSAHTPGFKKENAPGTKGALTKEHGTRDALRQEIVSKTFSDSQRGEGDTAIIGKLGAIQLFMSPKEELMTRQKEVEQSSTELHSIFKDIGRVDGTAHSTEFEKLANRVQTVRETDKMHAAKSLLVSGYDSLVSPEHKQLLTQAKGDVGEAMKLLHQESTSKTPSITFNTKTSSDTERLDQKSLREMSTQGTTTKTRPRALSSPRIVVDPSFKF